MEVTLGKIQPSRSRRERVAGRFRPPGWHRVGYTLAVVGGEQDNGSAYIDRALTHNPTHPLAWFGDAWLRIWRGEPEIALRHFTHLTRLSLRANNDLH